MSFLSVKKIILQYKKYFIFCCLMGCQPLYYEHNSKHSIYITTVGADKKIFEYRLEEELQRISSLIPYTKSLYIKVNVIEGSSSLIKFSDYSEGRRMNGFDVNVFVRPLSHENWEYFTKFFTHISYSSYPDQFDNIRSDFIMAGYMAKTVARDILLRYLFKNLMS